MLKYVCACVGPCLRCKFAVCLDSLVEAAFRSCRTFCLELDRVLHQFQWDRLGRGAMRAWDSGNVNFAYRCTSCLPVTVRTIGRCGVRVFEAVRGCDPAPRITDWPEGTVWRTARYTKARELCSNSALPVVVGRFLSLSSTSAGGPWVKIESRWTEFRSQ